MVITMADGDSVSSSSSSISSSSSRRNHATSSHRTSSSASSVSGRKRAAYSRTSTSSSISARHYAVPSYEMSSPSSPSPQMGKLGGAAHRISSPGLSAEEFKARLYHSFKERGLVDSLKSQLRTKLVSELQRSALSGPRHNENQESLLEGASLLHRAANSLVADHLKQCGYDYSLAVFLPESESDKDKLFTLHDLLDLLKIHPDSKLGKKLIVKLSSQQSKGLLWQILCEVARSHHGGSEEKGIQVDENPPHLKSLESKLKSVDILYSSKAEEENLGQYGIMQDKLTSLQRQIEARFKMETNMEISRFKESELKRVELEEREKCRKEIARARREMEQTYRAKSEALQERERSAMERLQKEREHVERETYTQRQSLLEELQVLRQRETELKREADVNARAAKFEEERCKTMEENLKVRETAVGNIQDTYDKRFKEQTRQFELEVQAKYSDRLRELDEKDSKLRAEKRNLQEESETLKGLKEDVKDKQKRLNELEILLQQMRHDAVASEKRNEVLNEKVRDMIDYQTVKETNAVLRRELENAKLRLSEFTNEQKMERARHEELLKQMGEQLSRPNPELLTLQGDLTRARQQTQQEKTLMEHREVQMKNKLQDEKEQKLELRRQLEEQSKQTADMNKQLSDLRAVLRETQTALQNEVYRRPVPAAGGAVGSPTHSDHVPVHDQLNPEDQYIDTALRQSHIDPQLLLSNERTTFGSMALAEIGVQHQLQTGQHRLLAEEDTRDNLQPMERLDTMSTRHQPHSQQRLLADEDSMEDSQPMTGFDTTGANRLLADESSIRGFAPMQRFEATAIDDGEVSADNSLAFLEETRHRFRQLEKEAENLEQTYQNFQYRVTNPEAIHSSPPGPPRIPTYQAQGGHPRDRLHFATPLQSRQTGSDHQITKPSSPPEPLVEYPLGDSMESAAASQYRNRPLQNRETPAGISLNRTDKAQPTPLENLPLTGGMNSTASHYRNRPLQNRETPAGISLNRTDKAQPTPLENLPLTGGMNSTASHYRNRPLQKRETPAGISLDRTDNAQPTPLENLPLDDGMNSTKVLPQTMEDVPLPSRGAQSMITSILPEYESSAKPSGNQQQTVVGDVPTGREQMSHLTHGTSYGDMSGSLRYEPLPKMDDLSNLPDQSQFTMKSHHKSSVSSLSEHSLHSEHHSLTQSPPPYTPPRLDESRLQAIQDVSNMPRHNESSSEEDLAGDDGVPHANEKGSSGFIPQHKEQEEERLRRLQEEEREEREWEEKRRQKEEERKRREEEAREREQQMLMELQRQEEQAHSHQSSNDEDDKSRKEEERRNEMKEDMEDMEEETGEGVKKDEDEGLNIDPVMQKYMQMVQQRKQQEVGSKVKKPQEEDEEDEQKASILSGLSQESISGVEAVDKQKSQGATTDDDDPFDDW
ncbi:uncharacterized protein [Amphiura filiformis]|uniref:uncharacterized protein n=1 Tax=Amphiura filiformis TaxID=82378 RepID=UPI003B20B6A1